MASPVAGAMTVAAVRTFEPPAIHRRQRISARGELAIGPAGQLQHLYQQGSARIRFPANHGQAPEAVLMNTAGGLTGGDRMHWRAELATRSELVITTAACEKFYKAGDTGENAQYQVKLHIRQGARLDWLPQESILYDGAKLSRRLDVYLEGDASALLVESLLFGRRAMGEQLDMLEVDDRWQIERDGQLLHVEALRIHDAKALGGSATLNAKHCLSTAIFCSNAPQEYLESISSRLRSLLDRFSTLCAGVSVLPGRLVLRLLGDDNLLQQRVMRAVLGVLRPDRALPRVWAV